MVHPLNALLKRPPDAEAHEILDAVHQMLAAEHLLAGAPNLSADCTELSFSLRLFARARRSSPPEVSRRAC